jgi:uncharacterized membrane protein
MPYYDGWYVMGIGMWFMMLFWFVLIVTVVYYLYKRNNNNNNEALELLKMKFVKEEISEEEYINKKSVLLKK